MHPKKVLVIDDEKSLRDLLKKALAAEGYQVILAADGKEGLNLSLQNQPDIILLDIMMPVMDGYQVLKGLKETAATKDIPVLFLSARNDAEERVLGLEAGAVDYITKPFYLREVLARIRIHVRLKDYEEELRRKNQALEEYSDLLLQLNARLEEISRRDELMNIWNRRAFNEQMLRIHQHSLRYDRPYSIIIADLDFFKNFNDLYGHQEGDRVLHAVAQTVVHACRVTDFVARYGGEEIVVLLPETDVSASIYLAERLIRMVRNLGIAHQGNNDLNIVTISAGAATFIPVLHRNVQPDEVLKKADDALYQAKHLGRNRVCHASMDLEHSLGGSSILIKQEESGTGLDY